MQNRATFISLERCVFLFAIFVSLFFSFLIYHRQSIINPDAICYLLSAREIGLTGISGAMNLCGQARWPFYSFLIYGLAKLTYLSNLEAAYLLDTFFSAVTVVTFIMLVKALGGRGRILWLAAGVILFAHSFNSTREYIIRDHGFWAFYLISLYQLLSYVERPSVCKAFLFSISILIAALFRIEGLIFLSVIPILTLFYRDHSFKQKAKGLFGFYFLLMFAGLVMMLWLFYYPTQSLEKFGRLAEIPFQLQHGFALMIRRYQEMQMAIVNNVLASDAIGQAGIFLALVFISWYLILVFNNLTWIYSLLLLYAFKNKVISFSKESKFVIYSYLGINILITFAFLLEKHFLSKRYLIALTLLLMLPIPFAINHLIKQSFKIRYRLSLLIILILFCFTIRNDFSGNEYKSYIKEAGRWIAENIPSNTSLYVNDYQLMYYSTRFDKKIFHEYYRQLNDSKTMIASGFKQYDFLALRIKKKDEVAFSWVNKLLAIKTFSNHRGDKVVIYQVIPQNHIRSKL